MRTQAIRVLESKATLLEQPSNVVEALVPGESAATLDEMANQVGEEILIGHPRNGRGESRPIELGPAEDALGRYMEQLVWKEPMVDVDA